METHQPGALILRTEAIFHHLPPNLAGGAILGDLFEEIIVRIEEKAEAGTGNCPLKDAATRPCVIMHPRTQREVEHHHTALDGVTDVVYAGCKRAKTGRRFASL